jgi:hypothetical protein
MLIVFGADENNFARLISGNGNGCPKSVKNLWGSGRKGTAKRR